MQSHTQDDTTNPIQKDVSQDGHAAPPQPSSTQQYLNRARQEAGPRGTASSPQREFSQPKNTVSASTDTHQTVQQSSEPTNSFEYEKQNDQISEMAPF